MAFYQGTIAEKVSLVFIPPIIAAGYAYTGPDEWRTVFPALKHASSVMTGYGMTALTVVGVDRLAVQIRNHDKESAADKLHKLRYILCGLGSLAYQFAAESGITDKLGTADPTDAIVGVAATVPGLMAGNYMSRVVNKYHTDT